MRRSCSAALPGECSSRLSDFIHPRAEADLIAEAFFNTVVSDHIF